MKTLKEDLRKINDYYKSLLDMLMTRNIPDIEGNLIVHHKKDSIQYYHSVKKDLKVTRKYLGKKEIKIIEELANKKYITRMKKLLNKRIKVLDYLLENFDENEIDNVYENLRLGENINCKPVVETFNSKYQKWLNEEDNSINDIFPGVIQSVNGITLKSKSEKIIADKLHNYGIKFKYESPLALNGKNYWPDFTIYSKKLRKKIYWEHLGLIDNENYKKKNFYKINIYILNGIIPGDNLILTFESQNMMLNDRVIETMIKEYFL